MATSAVDETFPPDNVKVDKSKMRAQALVIKNELTKLLTRINLPGQHAFGLTVTKAEVENLIAQAEQRASRRERLPGLLAFGIVSFTVSNN